MTPADATPGISRSLVTKPSKNAALSSAEARLRGSSIRSTVSADATCAADCSAAKRPGRSHRSCRAAPANARGHHQPALVAGATAPRRQRTSGSPAGSAWSVPATTGDERARPGFSSRGDRIVQMRTAPRRDRRPDVSRVGMDGDPGQHAQSSQRDGYDAVTSPVRQFRALHLHSCVSGFPRFSRIASVPTRVW